MLSNIIVHLYSATSRNYKHCAADDKRWTDMVAVEGRGSEAGRGQSQMMEDDMMQARLTCQDSKNLRHTHKRIS